MSSVQVLVFIAVAIIGIVGVVAMRGEDIESRGCEEKLRKAGCPPVREVVMKVMDGQSRGRWIWFDLIHTVRCDAHLPREVYIALEWGTERELDKLVKAGMLEKQTRKVAHGLWIEYRYPKPALRLVA